MRAARLAFAIALTNACAAATAAGVADATRGMPRSPGLVDVYRDAAKDRVLIGVHQFDTPFLLLTSLPWGVGSNDIGLDRGQPGDTLLVEFRRHGRKVMLVADNTRYIADSRNADERRSAQEAFAESVLWAGEIVAEDPGHDVLVDFSPFLLADRHGVAQRLASTKQGKYDVDSQRSAVLLDAAISFPDNAEFEALLTFKGPGEGEWVKQVAIDPEAISVREHVSLVRLPAAGFVPRPYHPASGGISQLAYDYATPLADSIETRRQVRFRLEPKEPGATRGPVKKPIVFYLDRGAPEPVRSALLEGANWWRSAFEKAGFVDAYRVELLPEGVDPMDARYNVISWVHRATRGWSYGAPLTDPRTGEIIRGSVTLGSQRVRQDILIAESLLAPYDKSNAAELAAEAQNMALARLRQLAAHEVGHAIGFAHNFAASRQGNGSVMDYPHPLLALSDDGRPHLDKAYGVGVGPWDDFLVAHAYGIFPQGSEASALAQLRSDIAARGFKFLSDPDARAPNSAAPDALLWDYGPDTLATYDKVLAVRRTALKNFGIGVLPPQRQAGELEARLVPVYLLHRYQTEAVARLLGGADYAYSVAGEHAAGTRPVAAATQSEALRRLVQNLSAEELALPPNVLDLVTPPGNDYARTREYFETRSAPLFDAVAAVEAGAALTCQFLLEPARLNRLAWQHARDAAQPGADTALRAAFAGTWRRDLADGAAAAVQFASGWTLLEATFGLLEGGQLHASVDASLRQVLREEQAWLERHPGDGAARANRSAAAQRIAAYFADPKNFKARALPTIPPGAPI